jgi:hypothetical protein
MFVMKLDEINQGIIIIENVYQKKRIKITVIITDKIIQIMKIKLQKKKMINEKILMKRK